MEGTLSDDDDVMMVGSIEFDGLVNFPLSTFLRQADEHYFQSGTGLYLTHTHLKKQEKNDVF